jgi:peptidyl-prolyl cis-trans isomerase C
LWTAGVACLITAAVWSCGDKQGGRQGGKADDPQAVLATVGRYKITREDLDRRVAQLPENTRTYFASPEHRVELLKFLVEEKLIVLAAEAQGLDREPELAARLEDARSDAMSRYYSEKVLLPRAQPDSTDFARYYQEHPEEFRVAERVAGRQIVVATADEAQALRRRLLRGAKFDSVRFEQELPKSIDEQTRNLRGALGYVSRGAPVRGLGGPDDAFVEAVMKVPVGELSEPIKTSRGFHLVRVEAHEPERVRELDSVRESLARKLARKLPPAKFQEIRQQLVDSLSAAYKVKIDTLAVLGDQAYGTQEAKGLFDKAQETEDPAARLRIYEQIVTQHPDTQYAAQAQFMIGFIYAEELKDKERARAALTTLIARYPSSELVDSARFMLNNMEAETPKFEDGAPAGTDRPSGGSGGD